MQKYKTITKKQNTIMCTCYSSNIIVQYIIVYTILRV